jgi:outer membrane protein
MKNSRLTIIICFLGLLFGISAHSQTKKWTLEECIYYALENNITIKNTALDSEIADIDKTGAIGNFLPTINASTSHSWNIGLNQNITTGLLENQTIQFTSAGLQMGVDIYNGLQNQKKLRRANLSKVASQYQLTKMQEDISLNVANAFLQILFNKENLKVQNDKLSNDVKQMERSAQLLEAGIIPRVDLLDMKATVAADEQRVIAAENTLLISKLSLAQLLQLDDFASFDVVDQEYDTSENSLLLQTPLAIYEKAKESRVELKIARNNLEIAEKDLSILKGSYQPRLQGFYNFNTRSANSDRITGFEVNPLVPTVPIGVVEATNQVVVQPNFTSVSDGPLPIFDQFDLNKGQSIGVQLTIPILNGFVTKTNVEKSKVAVERGKIAYEQEELNLQRNVYTAFTDAKGALNSYEASLVTLEARQEAFISAKERFEVGLMNAFDYNQSQTLLVNAQSEVLRTKYDYIFKTKILEFYFGIPIIQKP